MAFTRKRKKKTLLPESQKSINKFRVQLCREKKKALLLKQKSLKVSLDEKKEQRLAIQRACQRRYVLRKKVSVPQDKPTAYTRLNSRLRQQRFIAKRLSKDAVQHRKLVAHRSRMCYHRLSTRRKCHRFKVSRQHRFVLFPARKIQSLFQNGLQVFQKYSKTKLARCKLSNVEILQFVLLGQKKTRVRSATLMQQHLLETEKMYEKLMAIRDAALKMIEATQQQLKKQIDANVLRRLNISDAEYVRLKLCRLLYHTRHPNDPTVGFETMEKLLPQIYHQQLTGLSSEQHAMDSHEIDAVVCDDVLDTKETDPMEPVLIAVSRKSTWIRECNVSCPTLMTVTQASIVMNKLQAMVHAPSATLKLEQFYQTIETTEMGLIEFLRQQSSCSTGCRTIVKRLVAMQSYVDVNCRIINALKKFDNTLLNNICQLHHIPNAVAEMFLSAVDENENVVSEHNEVKVLNNFGKLINKTRSVFAELEVYPCDICYGLSMKRELFDVQADAVVSKAKEHATKDVYTVCLSCRRQMQQEKLPVRAVCNAMEIDACPAVLQNLNWIEKALIQRVRPVQSMVTLTDKAGRKTNVVASRGALVVLPVPTNGTMQHVADTLPSTANLKIVVRTTHGRRLVSLPRVLRALFWLKANNPLYHDVFINEQFKFSFDSVSFEKIGASQADLDDLIEKSDNEQSILEHEDFQLQPVMQNNNTAPNGTTFEQYTLKKSPYEPFNVHDPTLDVAAFFHLHPRGINGTKFVDRPVFASVRDVVRQRLANKDRSFATDASWLCFQHGLLQQQDLLGSMGISARMKKEKLTGHQIVNAIATEDSSFQKCLATNTASLRCHQPYWEKCKMKLKAHIRLFKAPTFFVTLNPSFADWTEVHDAFSAIYGCRVDKSNVAEFVAKDPFIWTRHFQHRLRTIMQLLIKNKNGPFGEVIHYFYRIEYQARGTEHVHMLLWVKDAPKTTDVEADIIKFIDKHITGRLPDRNKEPVLFDLVSRLQQHNPKCTNTCRRFLKYRGRVYTRCRFEFPRKCSGFTQLNKKREPLLGVRCSTTKYYTLRRRSCDTHTNDYNPALLLAWRGNVDVQFISPDFIDIINYITGYTTKNESSKKSSPLQQALQVDMGKSDLFKMLLSFLKQRETGVMEIVDWLMGHHMYEFDVSHVNVNTNAEDKRFRILKKKSELQDDSAGFVNNIYDVYYPQRA